MSATRTTPATPPGSPTPNRCRSRYAEQDDAPAAPSPAPSAPSAGDPELSHREILEILAGLLAALFTAVLSSTIVSNALPTIIADLEGTQTQYTWVVTASPATRCRR